MLPEIGQNPVILCLRVGNITRKYCGSCDQNFACVEQTRPSPGNRKVMNGSPQQANRTAYFTHRNTRACDPDQSTVYKETRGRDGLFVNVNQRCHLPVEVQHLQYQTPPLHTILSYFHLPPLFSSNIPSIHLNLIFPSPRSSKWMFPKGFPEQNSVCSPHLPHIRHMHTVFMPP